VAYLLQRIEAYNGLVILASNQRANIDDAFVRRLQAIIAFPMPSLRSATRFGARPSRRRSPSPTTSTGATSPRATN